MIETSIYKVKINDVVQSQIPEHINTDNPLFAEFLKQYYISQEFQGGTVDIADNLVEYKGLSRITNDNLVGVTSLTAYVDGRSDTINVQSTKGWPEQWGLLKINNEIITYTGITTNSFMGCVRGFSAIEKNETTNKPEFLTFTSTGIGTHANEAQVTNLSNIFLKEFLRKLKIQVLPGFEERGLFGELDEANFIRQAKDFYATKGTPEAFDILFRVLYNEDVDLVQPQKYLFKPSDADFIRNTVLLCTLVNGDPRRISGETLFQDTTPIQSSAAIYDIEEYVINKKRYYKVSLSTDTIIGNFEPIKKTYITEFGALSTDILNVDSTVGFASEGVLKFGGDRLTYGAKSYTQFRDIKGLSSTAGIGSTVSSGLNVYSYEEGDLSNRVELQVVEVLNDFTGVAQNQNVGSEINVRSLGLEKDELRYNAWIYNTPSKYSIFKIDLVSPGTYELILENKNQLYVGDNITVYDINTDTPVPAKVTSIISDLVIRINAGTLDLTRNHYLRRNLKTTNTYTADVQNTYSKGTDLYVASNSIPHWEINADNKIRTFNNSQTGQTINISQHNFTTGELVVYEHISDWDSSVGLNTAQGYYVKKINDNQIKLASTQENVRSGEYIDVFSVIAGVSTHRLTPFNLYGHTLGGQKLFKRIPIPTYPPIPSSTGKKSVASEGAIGLFANGVEIASYKSPDKVYFGAIDSVSVLNNGEGYDVVNPPRLSVRENISGVGASVYAHVSGEVVDVIVDNEGVDYLDTPIVSITGGGGQGYAEAKMKKVPHEAVFNSASVGGVVSTEDNTFTFKTPHGFHVGEELIYSTQGTTPIGIGTTPGNLVDKASYFAIPNPNDDFKMTITDSKSNSLAGIGTIDITQNGIGYHIFETRERRLKVDKVRIIDGGRFYNKENTLRVPNPTVDHRINKYTNVIYVPSHGYADGDEIQYVCDDPISGLDHLGLYTVEKLDDDNFKIGVDFGTVTAGIHTFRYPPIEVTIKGRQGISTDPASASPIIRGSIDHVHIIEGGKNYGSTVMNDNFRVPIDIIKGSGALLRPYVVNGRIEQIFVKDGGKDWYSIPDIIIEGTGYGAKARGRVNNGKLVGVDIIDKGGNYQQSNTFVRAETPGKNSILSSNINAWTLDEVDRHYDMVGDDDGYIDTPTKSAYGSKYVNYYAPKKLREFLGDDNNGHSPILGYAYDGNPIYGPIANHNVDGTGGLRLMKSSYALQNFGIRINGPDYTEYPAGSFVEDYAYVENYGDLDEHNGRFSVTPEYPNGIYAYHVTVKESQGDLVPVFPYVIGHTYHSDPVLFNYGFFSNQEIDPGSLGLLKNTLPYNLKEYEFSGPANRGTETNSRIIKVSEGGIEKLDIFESGLDYTVGDRVVFDNEGTNGFGALAKVSRIEGVGITTVTSSINELLDVELIPMGKKVLGITTIPHGLNDGYYINVTNTNFPDLEGRFQIDLEYVSSFLLEEMLPTGLTTSVSTSDDVHKKFRVDDILQIDSEKFKVLDLDLKNNKLVLERTLLGTAGAAHTYRSKIERLEKEFTYEVPRKLNFSTPTNYIRYFDAANSVGVGLTVGISTLGITSTGVGIGSYVSIVAAGNTTKPFFVPAGGIYIPGNSFLNNEECKYSPGAGTSLTYSPDGVQQQPLPSTVYISQIGNNIVGIKTEPTGSPVLFNGNIGIGNSHSLKTNRAVGLGTVQSFEITVTTDKEHGMRPGDDIDLTLVSAASSSVYAGYSAASRFVDVDGVNNPRISVTKGDTLRFLTHSPTLTDTKIEFFLDPFFTQRFYGSALDAIEITNVGVAGDNKEFETYTDIHFTENVPDFLFYKFESNNPTKIIEVDVNQSEYGKIVVSPSRFSGKHSLSTTTSNTFTYNIFDCQERIGYSTDSTISYTTTSENTIGPIAKVDMLNQGKGYVSIPNVEVESDTGNGADLIPFGTKIGDLQRVDIEEYGYDYPTDKTMQPQAVVPDVITLRDNFQLDSVGIVTGGKNYLIAPDLVVYNTKQDVLQPEAAVRCELVGNSVGEVEITANGGSMESTDNVLFPVNNSNGVGIVSASYAAPYVTLRLKTPQSGFTTEFPVPFTIGDKVFVENIGVSSGHGYNSQDYAFQYFTLTGVSTAFGMLDQATVTYEVDTDPGDHDAQQYGSVVKKSDMASFDIKLKEAQFYNGEEIYTKKASNNCIRGDGNLTNVLRVDSIVGFNTGDQIRGKVSQASAYIKGMQSFTGNFDTGVSIIRNSDWERDTGKLNEYFQRIQNSDYYQQFAYSLKSRVGISSWDEPVDSLAHIAGFKKHSDLLIPSIAGVAGSITMTDQVKTPSTIFLDNEAHINCHYNYDSVYEITNDTETKSDEIVFKSLKFGNSLMCDGNRVLEIDDISPQFYNDPAINRNIEIDTLNLGSFNAIKYYAQVVVTPSTMLQSNETQYIEFVISADDTVAFNNQYSTLSDAFNLGTFYTETIGDLVSVRFSPFNSVLTYDITFYKEIMTIATGVGATSFGGLLKSGNTTNVPANTSRNLLSVNAMDFKCGQVLVAASGNGKKEVVESTFIGIGSTAHFINYAEMDSDGTDLGDFSVNIDGNNQILLDWQSNVAYAATVSALASFIGVGQTYNNSTTGIQTSRYQVGDSVLHTSYTEIAQSPSSSIETIETMGFNDFTSWRLLVNIENVTDGEQSIFNMAVNTFEGDANWNRYGLVSTGSSDPKRDLLNTEIQVSGSNCLLRFTPRDNIDYIIRTSQIRITKPDGIPFDTVKTLS